MEENLKRANWILSAKHLDSSSAYHLWITLFRSRIWYAALFIAAQNKPMSAWLSQYVYRSIKTLLNLKGKPSSLKLLQSVTGLSAEQIIESEILNFKASRLLPLSEDDRVQLNK